MIRQRYLRRRSPSILIALVLVMWSTVAQTPPQSNKYSWLDGRCRWGSIAERVQPPTGYERPESVPGTLADWLRHLPLRAGKRPVRLYDGEERRVQGVHHAIIDIDIGDKNLQQCADAVIRLYAEYLYSLEEYGKIHFNFTSGDTAWFSNWLAGYRPVMDGNVVYWSKTVGVDTSYENFRRYLDVVFTYSGSYSLSQELQPVGDVRDMKIGDVFIQGGFPGHAVIVVDMAVNQATGNKVFLIAQSYMPAQDIHILKNIQDAGISPWYSTEFGDRLITPEWHFCKDDLMRF